MNINKFNEILKEGLEEYKKNEKAISKNIENMNVQYSPHNERPFAAFMTEYFAQATKDEEADIEWFHELPIKGIHPDEIDDIKKRFLKANKIKKEDIIKKYKSYNIDGYLRSENLGNIFIEYKVNKNFKVIDLALDFLKFLIYSNRSESNETFLYVVVFKGKNSFEDININMYDLKLGLNSKKPFGNDNNIYYFKKLSSKANRDMELKLKEKLIALDKLDSMKDVITTKLTNKEYEDFDGSPNLKNIKIYGNNVMLSNKMQFNSGKIINLQKKLESGIGQFASDIDDNNFNEIKKFIFKLKNTSLANEVTSNSKIKTSRQMTNWVLSLIKFIAEEEGEEIDFEIRDIDSKGHVSGGNSLLEGFNDMVHLSGELLKETFPSNYKGMVYKIIRHISYTYQLIFDYDNKNSKMPILNKKYVSFKNLKNELSSINNISGILLNNKNEYKSQKILDFEKHADNISEKMIANIINDFK